MTPTPFDRLQLLWRRVMDYGKSYLASGLLERAAYWLAHATRLQRLILGGLARGTL